MQKIRKKEGINEQELDNELILHDPATDKVHVLNKTAKIVWKLTDGKHTLEDVVNEIKSRFSENDNHNIKEDIETVIKGLEGNGLLLRD